MIPPGDLLPPDPGEPTAPGPASVEPVSGTGRPSRRPRPTRIRRRTVRPGRHRGHLRPVAVRRLPLRERAAGLPLLPLRGAATGARRPGRFAGGRGPGDLGGARPRRGPHRRRRGAAPAKAAPQARRRRGLRGRWCARGRRCPGDRPARRPVRSGGDRATEPGRRRPERPAPERDRHGDGGLRPRRRRRPHCPGLPRSMPSGSRSMSWGSRPTPWPGRRTGRARSRHHPASATSAP